MPRRDYLADLAAITAAGLPDAIQDFANGEEDGTFVFNYQLEDASTISMQAMIPEVSDYPCAHSWFVYTTSELAPPSINQVVDGCDFASLRIQPMLCKLASALQNGASADSGSEMALDEEVEYGDDNSDFGSATDDEGLYHVITEDEDTGAALAPRPRPADSVMMKTALGEAQKTSLQRRLRHDLHHAKQAGFRVSAAGSVLEGNVDCFVLISCRVAKLGLNEDILRAWQLSAEKYVTLVLRYPYGYVCLEEALRMPYPAVQMRMLSTSRFKLSYPQALRLFDSKRAGAAAKANVEVGDTTVAESLFIDRPLNDFLNDRFLPLVRIRLDRGFGWHGAEAFYNAGLGKHAKAKVDVRTEFSSPERTPPHLPAIATADHLADEHLSFSLPVAAMQLALRHLVRCTEFCQICHERIPTVFVALKPYVCSKPLCLYQYMSLGFGPSVEAEIIGQPNVVDLLVTFCYRAAVTMSLGGQLPIGLNMTVPPLPDDVSTFQREMPRSISKTIPLEAFRAKIDRTRGILQIKRIPGSDGETRLPARPGQWIYVTGMGVQVHARVREAYGETLVLGKLLPALPKEAMGLHDVKDETALAEPSPCADRNLQSRIERYESKGIADWVIEPPLDDPLQDVTIFIWNQRFEDFEEDGQQAVIAHLLNILPSVAEMRQYILGFEQREGSLAKWADRINPASLNILRWIIASNRSCIVQVDSLSAEDPPTEPGIQGLPPGYLQFRFAQGAPDKELRFAEAVKLNQHRHPKRIPTIFAWHGSGLENWHSIIREGLHFKIIANGRSCGDGVYHSLDLSVSANYCRARQLPTGRSRANLTVVWPNSRLRIDSAVCLNEIVNAPDEFRCIKPHIVVQHVDWIQTRYLLIQSSRLQGLIHSKKTTDFLEQDASLRPSAMGLSHLPGHGATSRPLDLPFTAIAHSRRNAASSRTDAPPSYRASEEARALGKAALAESRYDSEESSADDRDLHDPDSNRVSHVGKQDVPASKVSALRNLVSSFTSAQTRSPTGEAPVLSTSANPRPAPVLHTDFRPGTLAIESLPLLAPPAYATSQATRTLQRELQRVLAVQDTSQPAELGWYLDPSLLGNMYQWLFELHSFDPSLPLSSDLKKRGLSSIVLEVRFGAQFPYTPPFIRVVRPRFLQFLHGGGGHVTHGGAMCMELLTNSGWNPASTIEAVILQVRMALSSTDPKPARLDFNRPGDYAIAEAVSAFRRACAQHGWQVPADFDLVANATTARRN